MRIVGRPKPTVFTVRTFLWSFVLVRSRVPPFEGMVANYARNLITYPQTLRGRSLWIYINSDFLQSIYVHHHQNDAAYVFHPALCFWQGRQRIWDLAGSSDRGTV